MTEDGDLLPPMTADQLAELFLALFEPVHPDEMEEDQEGYVFI